MTLPSQELFDWWKPKLRALDPYREVGLDEIDALYAERPNPLYRALATRLMSSDRPAEFKVLLCGSRGSGKSTEITRFVREVSQRYCVVQTDIGAGLPAEASTLAVVTLLGAAALHAIRVWSAPDADIEALVKQQQSTPLKRGVESLQAALNRFGDSLPSVTQILQGVGGVVSLFDASTGAALTTAGTVAKNSDSTISAGTKLRNDLARGNLGKSLSPDQRDDAAAVVDAVNGILAQLATLAGRPPLLVADGLDKRTAIEDVQLALSDEYLLRDLRAPLVVTGPVNLRHDPRFRALPGNFRLTLLYNAPVRKHSGGIHPPGIAMLCDLYERRRKAASIPPTLLDNEIVAKAAHMCSGIVREFLDLLHATCMNALEQSRHDVTQHDLDLALKARRLEMEGYLNQGHIDILRRVLEKGSLPASPDADVLLFENFIACYPNDDIWFRPHEIIVAFIEARVGDD